MSSALDRSAYNQTPTGNNPPASSPTPGGAGWTDAHQAGYDMAMQHAASGVVDPTAFTGKTDFASLQSAAADGNPVLASPSATPSPSLNSTPRTPPSAASTGAALVAANLASRKPLIDAQAGVMSEQQRVASLVPNGRGGMTGVSQSKADWDQRPGGTNDPFTNGTFKSADARSADMQDGTGAYAGTKLAGLPRETPVGPTPPVGGTQAVTTDPTRGLNGTTRTPAVAAATDMATAIAVHGAPGAQVAGPDQDYAGTGQAWGKRPGGGMEARLSGARPGDFSDAAYSSMTGKKTTFDATPGTRRPIIAGANGVNVAADFVDPKDPTLNKNYLAGLPRARPRTQYALPNARRSPTVFAQR